MLKTNIILLLKGCNMVIYKKKKNYQNTISQYKYKYKCSFRFV